MCVVCVVCEVGRARARGRRKLKQTVYLRERLEHVHLDHVAVSLLTILRPTAPLCSLSNFFPVPVFPFPPPLPFPSQTVPPFLSPVHVALSNASYIKVCDFGFAKKVIDRTYTLCGTPEYLAPELVLGKGHNRGVDIWALGILVYEMLFQFTPFADHNAADHMVICKNIVKCNIPQPPAADENAMHLVAKLLKRDPHKRLGCGKDGAKAIKTHRFFGACACVVVVGGEAWGEERPRKMFVRYQFGMCVLWYQLVVVIPLAGATVWCVSRQGLPTVCTTFYASCELLLMCLCTLPSFHVSPSLPPFLPLMLILPHQPRSILRP